VPTFLSGIFGLSAIPVSGQASATANPLTYVNYYFIVDASQSMGIGATQSDEDMLYQRVAKYSNGSGGEAGCVFGCHVKVLNNSAVLQTYTNEDLAHSFSPAVTLRIDSAVTAIKNAISLASANGQGGNIKIGLYTMSEDPVSGTLVNEISPPSLVWKDLTKAAGKIDLGNNVLQGYGDSDFTDQLAKFKAQYLPATNGSGASAVSPQNYVFIITDGLDDECQSSHCMGTLGAASCAVLKASATVGVIYTIYNPIYANDVITNPYESNYQTFAANYVPQIPAALQSCTSDPTKYYFPAKDGPEINTALQALMTSTLQQSRLQQ
jgi:hypothetical protein